MIFLIAHQHDEAEEECWHDDGQTDQRGADWLFVAVSRLANQPWEKPGASQPIGLKNKHRAENQQNYPQNVSNSHRGEKLHGLIKIVTKKSIQHRFGLGNDAGVEELGQAPGHQTDPATADGAAIDLHNRRQFAHSTGTKHFLGTIYLGE